LQLGFSPFNCFKYAKTLLARAICPNESTPVFNGILELISNIVEPLTRSFTVGLQLYTNSTQRIIL